MRPSAARSRAASPRRRRARRRRRGAPEPPARPQCAGGRARTRAPIRPSCSSTAAASPNGSPRRSTIWPARIERPATHRARWPSPTTAPSRARSERHRGAAQARGASSDRGHVVARAGNRHGRGRPRRPDRGADQRRLRPSAHRPGQPRRGRRSAGNLAAEAPARPGLLRGGDGEHAPRRGGGDILPAQPARRPRAADRGHRRDGRDDRARALRPRARRGAVRGGPRERAAMACSTC